LRHALTDISEQISKLLLDALLQLVKHFIEKNYLSLVKDEDACFEILENVALLFFLNDTIFFFDE
jgi:hypothetical protein